MAGLVVTRGNGSTRDVVSARSSVLGSGVSYWFGVILCGPSHGLVFDQDEYVASGGSDRVRRTGLDGDGLGLACRSGAIGRDRTGVDSACRTGAKRMGSGRIVVLARKGWARAGLSCWREKDGLGQCCRADQTRSEASGLGMSYRAGVSRVVVMAGFRPGEVCRVGSKRIGMSCRQGLGPMLTRQVIQDCREVGWRVAPDRLGVKRHFDLVFSFSDSIFANSTTSNLP